MHCHSLQFYHCLFLSLSSFYLPLFQPFLFCPFIMLLFMFTNNLELTHKDYYLLSKLDLFSGYKNFASSAPSFCSDRKFCAVLTALMLKECDPTKTHCLGGFICTQVPIKSETVYPKEIPKEAHVVIFTLNVTSRYCMN